MKRRTLITSLMAFSLTVLGLSTPVLANGWELIGERSVRLVVDRDIIPVGRKKQYDYLKLKVKGASIQLLSLTIQLGSGRTINPPMRMLIPKDGESRVIDLPGNNRYITSVTLVYKSIPGSGQRAVIQLYGKTR